MIPRISSGIVRMLLRNKIIKADENEIYQYGLEMVLSTAIMLLIVLGCGLIFGELISSILFFIIFALIRSSSGDYHAETHFKCKCMLI
jgi:accessory gene regulator B